ncbi:MAG: hypothetical protein NTV93_20565 [Verrucomicrobia bacterium]|nr:hypothetical protein [Verrucomicrobiota bacterium]
MKNYVLLCSCLVSAAFAGEPLFQPIPQPPSLIPVPVLVIQENQQLVITDKSPIPVMVIQKQPQLWTTSTGEVLMPLNLRLKEGK